MSMEQETTNKTLSMPGTPLQQISQDRINQLRIPPSPSVPAHLHDAFDSPSRRGSDVASAPDVKSKIAFLNNLANSQYGTITTSSFAIAASPTRSPIKSAFTSPTKSHSRANSTITIPTDPSDVTNLVQTLYAQLEQSRNRERLVAERVESLMEQLSSAHTRSKHEQKENDKEIKSMKKQVHKAELALIRCQQELHESRNEQEGFKVRAEHERQAKEKSRQEAFERARTLASNVEELEVVKRERDLLMGENETLKAVASSMDSLRAQEKELSSIRDVDGQRAVEGSQQKHVCSNGETAESIERAAFEAEILQDSRDELEWVKSQLKREQDLVHFMNMQCQFRACPCRMAEKAGVRFVHDHEYDQRQEELARAKGVKRKAEDELPQPKYVTLRECFDQTTRQRQLEVPQHSSQKKNSPEPNEMEDTDPSLSPNHSAEADDDSSRATSTLKLGNADNMAGVISLEEAADIPLPSPHSDDMDPTALLEEMTQVMVQPEPAATAKHFAFSTSMSSRPTVHPETPALRQSHSAVSVNTTDDLFDIRPPRHLPPRPSTVMGLRTVGSPIRMIPQSPEHRQSLTPSASPPQHRTMQIPLRDSPPKNAITQRRSHSRPRDRSRGRSPTPGRGLAEANSPSADTYFPITPKQKIERQPRTHIQVQSAAPLQALHTQAKTVTTMVPLRGFEDDQNGSIQGKPIYDHAHTQPLELETFSRGRQPHVEGEADTSAPLTMLPGTPITREAALAQIRARRDRARSIAMRKQSTDEESGRVKTPKSVAKRGVMLNREAMSRDISNLSQASAPSRF